MLRRVIADVIRSLASPRREPAADAPNPLEAYFYGNQGRLMRKWKGYFEIYHRHFAQFRGRSPVVLEIGVYHGGSLQMWRDYFGPGARIVGIDVDTRCRQFEEAQISVLIGDQQDRSFLAEVKRQLPHIDIVIDDGGHTMAQQITSFEELYPHIQPRGVYLCEDIHTSMMEDYGGGFRKQGTFLEYSKALVDCLYAWYSEQNTAATSNAMTRSTYALHFYDSVLAVEKRPIDPPQEFATGKPSF